MSRRTPSLRPAIEALACSKRATLAGVQVAGTKLPSLRMNTRSATASIFAIDSRRWAALETAVGLDPTFKQAWTNLGNVYQSMGDSARATAAFANAR